MKIYVVKAFGGQWEDSWESNIKAFTTEEDAKIFIENCEHRNKKWMDKAQRTVDEFGEKNYRTIDINIAIDYNDCWHKVEELELWGISDE